MEGEWRVNGGLRCAEHETLRVRLRCAEHERFVSGFVVLNTRGFVSGFVVLNTRGFVSGFGSFAAQPSTRSVSEAANAV
eukprot:5284829-Prymnesium_polylepis.1